jgi:hypothetical protein
MEIPDIIIPNNSIRIADIRDLNINVMPDWMSNPPQALPIYPPVSTQVGIPIVNIPGCVESHRDSSENQTLKMKTGMVFKHSVMQEHLVTVQ